MRGCLNTIIAIAQVDGIQITFQNLVLVLQLFFQLDSQVLFLEFTFETFYYRLIGPVFEYIIFQKLLGNGTGAF